MDEYDSNKADAWEKFAAENGYAVGPGMELEEALAIREYWEQELEARVMDRDALSEQMRDLTERVEKNQKNLDRARFLHDNATRTIIQRMRRLMEPTNVAKMDAENNDPFGEDE